MRSCGYARASGRNDGPGPAHSTVSASSPSIPSAPADALPGIPQYASVHAPMAGLARGVLVGDAMIGFWRELAAAYARYRRGPLKMARYPAFWAAWGWVRF
jgi:hypothetical protein